MKKRILMMLIMLVMLIGLLPTVAAATEGGEGQSDTGTGTYSIFDAVIPFKNIVDCQRTTYTDKDKLQEVCSFTYPYCGKNGEQISVEVPGVVSNPENYYYKFSKGASDKIVLTLYSYDNPEFSYELSNNGIIQSYGENCFIYASGNNYHYGSFVSFRDKEYHFCNSCINEIYSYPDEILNRLVKAPRACLRCGCAEVFKIVGYEPSISDLENLSMTEGLIGVHSHVYDSNKRCECGTYQNTFEVVTENAGIFAGTTARSLFRVANAHAVSSGAIHVYLDVTQVNPVETEKTAIESIANGDELHYLDLSLFKRIDNNTPVDIGAENDVLLSITIPFASPGRELNVYRYHDSVPEKLTINPEKGEEGYSIGNGTITINAKKFSTYAVGVGSAIYDLWVGGIQVSESNKGNIVSAIGNGARGEASFDSTTNTLTLNDFSYEGSGHNDAAIWTEMDLNIKLSGKNILTSNDYSITTPDEGPEYDLIISGNGYTDRLIAGNAICASGKITIEDVIVETSGVIMSQDALSLTNVHLVSEEIVFARENLTVVNSTIYTGGYDDYYYAINGKNIIFKDSTISAYDIYGRSISVEDSYIICDGIYDDTGITYVNSFVKTSWNTPCETATPAGIAVAGRMITSANADDVFGDGKVSYDFDTNTLTLNGFTYTGPGDVYRPDEETCYYRGIVFPVESTTLVLMGENSILCEGFLYTDYVQNRGAFGMWNAQEIKFFDALSSLTVSATDAAFYHYNSEAPTITENVKIFAGDNVEYAEEVVQENIDKYETFQKKYLKIKPDITYIITFDANGGTATMAAITVEEGDYTLPACGFTAPIGKQFKAWRVNGQEYAVGDTITVDSPLTITALWETIVIEYPYIPPYITPSTDTEITVPVKNPETSVEVTAKVEENKATVEEIKDADLAKVTETKEEAAIEIDVTVLEKEIDTVVIPTESMEKIAEAAADTEKNVTGLTIKLSTATVTLDAEALAAIVEQADGENIQLNVDDVHTERLNSTQMKAIEKFDVHKGIEAYFTSNGQRIGDFKGGSVTVEVPFEVPTGYTPEGFSVWYVDDEGNTTKYKSTYVDGKLVFVVNHFSDYIVVYDAVDAAKATTKVNRTFRYLCLKGEETTEDSINLVWNEATDADGYVVYGNKCNSKGVKYEIEKLTIVKDGDITNLLVEDLEEGTYYKFLVKAYKLVNGKKVFLGKSKTIHVTTDGGKYGNAKAVDVNELKVTLKVGETFDILAEQVREDKKIAKHTSIKYESNKNSVATVNKNGSITAKTTGAANIYVYAQNGAYTKVRVTVE